LVREGTFDFRQLETMKFGVVVFPGSNCDRDIYDALTNDLGQEVVMLWHKDKDLGMFTAEDCIILPGGFSFGDYLRCGAIARFSPMMQSVIEFATKGGKVFGVCNGFQILCESHLLPGALLRNAHQKFVCKNVFLRADGYYSSVLKHSEQSQISPGKHETNGISSGHIYKIPVAHGEGKYYANEKILDELEANGQVIFRYCDENGMITAEANPNGAARNIAGICNAERNVWGMMPHPERACSQLLGNTDGQHILKTLIMTEQLVH
jgi:phosphoribosylformylglycinamidine synthase subunit PurQ / glutaminase